MSKLEALEKQIKELAEKVEKLVKEVEELKEAKKGVAKPVTPSVHDPYGVMALLKKELEKKEVKPGEKVGMIIYAGVIKSGDKRVDEWNNILTLDEILEVHPARIANLVAPLSSEQRVRILKALLEGPTPVSKLSEKTGLKGGELYHHLKELIRCGYITVVKRGIYALTVKGEVSLIMISGIAHWLEKPVPEELLPPEETPEK